MKSSQSFVNTRDIATVSITKHVFWNAAPSIRAILMIVGETGPHKSRMPLLIGFFSFIFQTSLGWLPWVCWILPPPTKATNTAKTIATWQPPLPLLFCHRIHHKNTIANHTTVQQRQPNILATTQHHKAVTSPDTNWEVWFVIAFVHLLRPRLNISHCYPPMDSWEGTMCLIADGQRRWSLLRREWMNTIEPYWTSLRPFVYHWTWNNAFISLAKCWEENNHPVLTTWGAGPRTGGGTDLRVSSQRAHHVGLQWRGRWFAWLVSVDMNHHIISCHIISLHIPSPSWSDVSWTICHF